MEALTQDEDLAVEMLRRPTDSKPPKRRMSEWSAEVELLSVLVDRIGELIQATTAVHGAKPRPIPPAPRPAVAIDRVRDSERMRRHRALVARVLPHTQQSDSSTGGERPPL